LDFSPDTPVKMLDIHADLSGDVLEYFVDYSPKRNLRAAKEGIESTDSEDGLSTSIAQFGYVLDDLIERACAAANGGTCTSSLEDIETESGDDDIAADALSKPSQASNWPLWTLVPIFALLLSVSILLVLRKRR
jgi:hypothetical protein